MRYNYTVMQIGPEEQAMNPDRSNPLEGFPREVLPPELVEWARQTFDEDEFLAQVREMEISGGFQLEDFLPEVEARARSQ